LDNLEIFVPSDAFNEDNQINISNEDGSDEFGEFANSGLYQISGLPETITKPIRIIIKYNGTLTGDPLIAIGEMLYVTSLDSMLYSFHAETAIDSSGYLIFEISPNSNLIKSG